MPVSNKILVRNWFSKPNKKKGDQSQKIQGLVFDWICIVTYFDFKTTLSIALYLANIKMCHSTNVVSLHNKRVAYFDKDHFSKIRASSFAKFFVAAMSPWWEALCINYTLCSIKVHTSFKLIFFLPCDAYHFWDLQPPKTEPRHIALLFSRWFVI